MKTTSIERQVETLKVDVKRYAAKARQRHQSLNQQYQALLPSQVKALGHLIKAQAKMGISDGDFMNLARHNLLPEKIQTLYAVARGADLNDDNSSYPSRSINPQKPRWNLRSWRCSCGETKTRWFRTHLDIKDRYQIYCASCLELAGWGSDQTFKSAQTTAQASLLTIDNPFDRYEYKPPLMTPPPNGLPRNRIRAKQSQSA